MNTNQRKIFVCAVTVLLLLATFIYIPPANKANATTGFVTRSGTQLKLGTSTFRFSGANIFELGMYHSDFEAGDSLDTAKEMGATVVRTFGAETVGYPDSIEPALGVFNEAALVRLDSAIKEAGDRGMRLVLPLVDPYNESFGGVETYDGWRGVATDGFYANATVISDFEQRISTILNRVNTLTGVAYKNDPAILAWETGNELHLTTQALPPTSWTQTIADYIKGIDTNHLVMDGEWNGSGFPSSAALALTNVDIYDDHFYPLSVTNLNSHASTTYAAGKAYYVGEYAWNERACIGCTTTSGDTLSSFLTDIEIGSANTASGDTFWSLMPHSKSYGYFQNADGFTLHYPGENSAYPGTPDMRSRTQALRNHAYAMSGLTVPANGTPKTPLIYDVTGSQITWRGAANADTYTVERSTAGSSGPWTVICNQCATDNNTPWTDTTAPGGTVWYRVKGYNLSNVAGLYSPAYQANVTSSVLLSNPGFESGLTSWSAFLGGGSLSLVSSGAHSGTNAAMLSSRTGTWMGPSQNVTSNVSSEGQGAYNISGWAKLSTGSDNVVITVQINDSSGTHYAYSSSIATGTGWTQITGLASLNWIGTLTSVIYYIQTTNSLADLYTDDFSLQKNSSWEANVVLNDNNAGITYSGSWGYGANRGAGDYMDDFHSTGTNNDFFQYTFTGTGIDYITEINTDRGNVDIYIDGVFQQTVNCNSAWGALQTVYSKTGLAMGSHTIKGVKTSGSYMGLDKLVASYQTAPTRLNDTAAGIIYSGSWGYGANRGVGDYMDDFHSTGTNGDFFQYSFFGQGIDFITETNPDRGNVDIYIDGTFDQTVNCNRAGATQQTVYSKRWLSNGSHTLKAVKTSGSYMGLDELVAY